LPFRVIAAHKLQSNGIMADSTPPSKPPATAKGSAKQPPKKAAYASPKKKTAYVPGITVKPVSAYPLLTCYSFHEDIQYEAYIYAKDAQNDMFLNSYRKASKQQELTKDLQDAGFVPYQRRRIPGTSTNAVLKQQKDPNFDRIIIVRAVESKSTAETRKEGLKVLKAHFMNLANTNYPPENINTVDNVTPSALDDLFLDEFIENLIKEMYDDDVLTNEFYSTYPEFAKMLWKGSHYSDFARSLGFP
jgi:hypothetical protein